MFSQKILICQYKYFKRGGNILISFDQKIFASVICTTLWHLKFCCYKWFKKKFINPYKNSRSLNEIDINNYIFKVLLSIKKIMYIYYKSINYNLYLINLVHCLYVKFVILFNKNSITILYKYIILVIIRCGILIEFLKREMLLEFI